MLVPDGVYRRREYVRREASSRAVGRGIVVGSDSACAGRYNAGGAFRDPVRKLAGVHRSGQLGGSVDADPGRRKPGLPPHARRALERIGMASAACAELDVLIAVGRVVPLAAALHGGRHAEHVDDPRRDVERVDMVNPTDTEPA